MESIQKDSRGYFRVNSSSAYGKAPKVTPVREPLTTTTFEYDESMIYQHRMSLRERTTQKNIISQEFQDKSDDESSSQSISGDIYSDGYTSSNDNILKFKELCLKC